MSILFALWRHRDGSTVSKSKIFPLSPRQQNRPHVSTIYNEQLMTAPVFLGLCTSSPPQLGQVCPISSVQSWQKVHSCTQIYANSISWIVLAHFSHSVFISKAIFHYLLNFTYFSGFFIILFYPLHLLHEVIIVFYLNT